MIFLAKKKIKKKNPQINEFLVCNQKQKIDKLIIFSLQPKKKKNRQINDFFHIYNIP